MKHLFGKSVFGFLLASLCSLTACMTEVDRPTSVDNAPGIQEQSLNNETLDNDMRSSESPRTDLSATVTSCVDSCDGDEGCILCCKCTHPNLCCM